MAIGDPNVETMTLSVTLTMQQWAHITGGLAALIDVAERNGKMRGGLNPGQQVRIGTYEAFRKQVLDAAEAADK